MLTPVRSTRVTSLALVLSAALLLPGCNQGARIRAEALAASQPVTFAASDGVQLSGRLFGPADATAGVVLAHMLPADQSSWFDFAQQLASQGYRVLTFDFRGYCPGGDAGCSKGEKDIPAAWKDVAGAVTEMQSLGVQHLALVGASMGGTASLVAAAQTEAGLVAAVITLSAPQSISGLVAGPDVLQGVIGAKLFIAGSEDQVAAGSAQAFYDESAAPKRVQILTTADHGTDILTGSQGEVAKNFITGWLDQYVPVGGLPAPPGGTPSGGVSPGAASP